MASWVIFEPVDLEARLFEGVGEALLRLAALGLGEHAVDHRLVAGFERAGLDHVLGGQHAALIELDAGIAEALRAVGLLQRGQRRVAVGHHDALIDRLLDEIGEGVGAGVTHDHDAARPGGECFLELGDHRFRRPGRELGVELIDAERLGGRRRAGLAGEGGAVAGIAAHLHVDRDALAGRLVGGLRGPGEGERGDARQQQLGQEQLRKRKLRTRHGQFLPIKVPPRASCRARRRSHPAAPRPNPVMALKRPTKAARGAARRRRGRRRWPRGRRGPGSCAPRRR